MPISKIAIFFNKESAKDLAKKLLSLSPQKIEQKKIITNQFDFKQTTKIILENIV